jgi:hypothetical protein
MVWLNQKFSQSSFAICPILLHVGSVDVCATCWWEISNVCLSCLRDPPILIVVLLLFNKEKQKETDKGSTS